MARPSAVATVLPSVALAQRVAVVLALCAGLAVALYLDDRRALGRRLRSRFVLGVPWGTLATLALVLAVYLLVQGGLGAWGRPTTIPFRAWSYFYPLGVVLASFAHEGPGHLLGNLVGTLVLAPLAEFAWGHFPRRRGASSFGSLRTNPFARALAVPAAAVAVGLFVGAFSLGPIIGFSGVVFAFAGVALVAYPLRAVVALAAGRLVRVGIGALREPTVTATASPQFSTPWWAEIAVQGHALGLLVGVLVGVWLVHRGTVERPTALRLWTGVALFGVAESLWAVYWFRGGGTFVLYRAAGLAMVAVLAALVTVAVVASARPLVGSGPAGESLRTIPRWQAGTAALLVVLAGVAGPAVATKVATATDEPLPGDPIEVRDYEVTYAENVENGMVSVVDVEAFGESTSVNTSGVIVRSRARNVWLTAVSKRRLAFAGRQVVALGGVGWRERVVVNRTGWVATGGNATYLVRLRHRDRVRTVFAAPPANASPVVAGRNLSVHARPDGFAVGVRSGDRTAFAPVPERNGSVTVAGVRVVRTGRDLVARRNGTRVVVATRETYR